MADFKDDFSVKMVSNSIEKQIITGMIVDSVFLQEISRAAKPEYFQNDVSKILVSWIMDYFLTEHTSPGEEIQEIFNLNISDLDEDEAKITRLFLKKTIEDYTGRPFNRDYVLPKALEYLELNAYEYKTLMIQRALRKRDVHEVKSIFNNASKEVFKQTTRWQNFSDKNLLYSWWDEKNDSLMSFPGALGRYLPKVERGRLYAMLGPPKRGKTHWLLEWGFNGAVDGLKVAIFSLEMNEKELDARWKEKLSGKEIMEKKYGMYTVPIIDCRYNLKGECEREEYIGDGQPVTTSQQRLPYEEYPEHIVCRNCENFRPLHWMQQKKINRLTRNEARKAQTQFDEHFGKDKVRLMSFPISTATVEDLERALDDLEFHDDFIPDLVIVDYADILKEDIRIGDKRHRVGDNWKQLSRMAKVRHFALITASQGNRNSAKKNRLDIDDVSEDFSKIMTIDGIFAINEQNFEKQNKYQTDKYWQVQRIETISLRYGKFTPGLQCVVLNDLSRGQIYIDSYIDWQS